MASVSNLITAFSALGFGSNLRDDDIIDRLNHWVMYGVYIAFAVCVGAKQFVDTPIFCWLPAQYSVMKRYRGYANYYCWVNTLYSFDFEEQIPRLKEDRLQNDVGFYRWVPMLFVVLAVLYRVPKWIWAELKDYSGVKLSKISCTTLETALLDQKSRDRRLSHVAWFMHRWLTRSTRGSKTDALKSYQPFRKSRVFLVTLYIFTKWMYLLNVIAQFCIISKFLNINFWSFGFKAIASYLTQGHWEDKEVFPRIAMCDLDLRQLQNVVTESIQCVIGLNLFLEKMFLIIWFFSMFILVANFLSLLKWTWTSLAETKTTQFLLKYSGVLRSAAARGGVTDRHLQVVQTFAKDYLGHDGVFVLRIVAANTSELLTLDLLRQIWLRYKQELKMKEAAQQVRPGLAPNGGVKCHSGETAL